MERFIAQGGILSDLVFTEKYQKFILMKAVKEIVPGAILTDTGTAALLGITADPAIRPNLKRNNCH